MKQKTDPSNLSEFIYSGEELDHFAYASNWKGYWSSQIAPFIGTSVIEIGAGIGSTAKSLNTKHYEKWLAVEPDITMYQRIENAKGTLDYPKNMDTLLGTSRNVPTNESYDSALYIDVLEHIEDDHEELSHIQKCLSKGGRVIILSPAHQWLFSEFDAKVGHYRRYDIASLTKTIPAGFTILKIQYLDSVGMLASLVNKWFLKSESPTQAQILFWDRIIVKTSIFLDRMLGFRFGKTILCILQKE